MKGSRFFFNSLNSVNVSNTINPVTLNPYVYYQTYDTSFLNPPDPSLNDPINRLYRYNDGLFTATGNTDTTNCVPKWSSLGGKNMLYFNGTGLCFSPPCTGCTNYYNTGQDISFISQSGYYYTIYFVGKPISGLTNATVFSDYDENYGDQKFYIDNNNVYFESYFSNFILKTPLYNIPVEINSSVSELQNKNLRIFSIRGRDTFDTVTNAIYSYVNGVQTTAITQNNLSNVTSPSGNLMSIGTSVISDSIINPYKGYFSELIIFNELHSLDTHTKVINFLKNRWGIS